MAFRCELAQSERRRVKMSDALKEQSADEVGKANDQSLLHSTTQTAPSDTSPIFALLCHGFSATDSLPRILLPESPCGFCRRLHFGFYKTNAVNFDEDFLPSSPTQFQISKF